VYIIVQGSLIKNVVLQLFKEYRYRPSVFSGSKGITCVLVQSMSDRGMLRFVNPVGYADPDRVTLPSSSSTAHFASTTEYIDYVRCQDALTRGICTPYRRGPEYAEGAARRKAGTGGCARRDGP